MTTATADVCPCGCGEPVPAHDGRGRRRQYATPACRLRLHRARGANIVSAPASGTAPRREADRPKLEDRPPAILAADPGPRMARMADLADGWCPFRGWQGRRRLDSHCPPAVEVLEGSPPVPRLSRDHPCLSCRR